MTEIAGTERALAGVAGQREGTLALDASKPRSDVGTIVIHWAAVILVVVSLLTGLRIAADAHGAIIAPLFEFMLPNGEVWTFHVLAGLSLFSFALVYVVYLFRAALAKRNSLKRIKPLTMKAPARYRWQAANVLLHWLAFTALVVLMGTGAALYVGYGGALVVVHRMCALFLIAYIFIHTFAHFMYGGLWQLLRLFRPAPLAKSDLVHAAPFATAILVGVLVASGVVALDLETRPTLIARATDTPPVLDGRLDDAVWQNATVAVMPTQQGENSTGFMQSRVEVRAAYDAENIYFAFRWSDPTMSLMRIPMIKEADGWHVMAHGVGQSDVIDYYEDKLAILFADHPAFGGGGTTHMGYKPLADKPSAQNKRGLHYTTDDSILDLWQWKAARGGMLGHVDDMFIGPPIEPSEAQVAGTERYSAGYLPDPGQPIYVYNYKAHPGQGYDGTVDIVRLPIDYRATMAAMKTIPDSPNTSNDEGAVWWLTNETSVPYSKELDDQIPVGTIVPGVLNINEYEGDRADIKGGAAYADGHWTVEASRKLVTGSKYDTTFEKGKTLYLYVSAFDHVQTRHTRHERPIVMELK
jgi:cytochrome b subunit of formate dehydrogenase